MTEPNKVKVFGIIPSEPEESIPVKIGAEGALDVTMEQDQIRDSDNDTKVQTEESGDEDKIRFDTAGSQRMIILDSGQVDIGHEAVGEDFSVDGNIETLDGHYIKTDKVRARDGDGLLLEDDGGNQGIFIEDGGNVGIGIANPTRKLEVTGGCRFNDSSSIFNNCNFYLDDVFLGIRDAYGGNYYIAGIVQADDGYHFCLVASDGFANRNLIFTDYANYNKDHDHDVLSANPTIFLHSATNPDTLNTEWGSFAHDTNDFIIECGKGDIYLKPATGRVGVNLAAPLDTLHVAGSILADDGVMEDRGDPAVHDFDVGDLTTDGAWNDLDLSAIVPANAKSVLLQVAVSDETPGLVISFRKNGNSNNIATSSVKTQVANISNYGTFPVPCDSDRKIEYGATNSVWSTINIDVLGWWN